METKDTLVLDNEHVLAYYDKASQYGEALAIGVTEESDDPNGSWHKIRKWLADNGDTITMGKIKEKSTQSLNNKDVKPFYFKITSQTKILDLDNKRLAKEELASGINIGLVARAVPYKNDFGSGIMRILETIIVFEPQHRTKKNVDAIKNAREERKRREGGNIVDEDSQLTVATEQSNKNAQPSQLGFEGIDMDNIPF